MQVFAFLNGVFDGVRPAVLVVLEIVLFAVDFFIAFRAAERTFIRRSLC